MSVAESFRKLTTLLPSPGRVARRSFFTSRAHGAPHAGHTPFADVPARTHGSTNFGG